MQSASDQPHDQDMPARPNDAPFPSDTCSPGWRDRDPDVEPSPGWRDRDPDANVSSPQSAELASETTEPSDVSTDFEERSPGWKDRDG